MVYKSKMTIHSSMRFIPKRHWPVLLEMRENGVETGGLPLPGSLQVITTIIGYSAEVWRPQGGIKGKVQQMDQYISIEL